MLAGGEVVHVLKATQFLCSRHILFLFIQICVFAFILREAVCAQVTTFIPTSQFSTMKEDPKQISVSEYGRSLSGITFTKTLDREKLFQNVTNLVVESTSPVAIQQNAGTEIRNLSSEISDDYSDKGSVGTSYVSPDVLRDLEPEELILSHDQAAAQRMQNVVKDGFVFKQKMELLRFHNFYRGNITPPAGDMSFMEWDERLAQIAQLWANRCEFKHGFPPHSYSGAMGQNLYMGYDPTGIRALLLWYEEYQYYNLQKLECLPREQCGHYTQMVWGKSRLVGCGMKRCGEKKFFVVCHYYPPGNVIGQAPYVVGKPCSQCELDHGGLCTNKLCVTREQCSRNPANCNAACPLECHNCGVLNTATCKCMCADGWDSLDCSRRCTDIHERCGKNPGWPSASACFMNEYAVADIYCRKMCGKCRDVEGSSTNTCCSGVVCSDGYILDQKICKCRLLCPGPKCHHGEDSGTLRLSKNAFVILFAFAVQVTFRL